MTWFEDLTGCAERSPDYVRQHLEIIEGRLHSHANNKSWLCGELETPTLADFRARVRALDDTAGELSLQEVVANVQYLHRDAANAGALFQVASQFNLLEMTSPGVTPERGIGIYEQDYTQGPACAIAAGAGTILRNYFVVVDGEIGQTADRQVDCLAGVGALLGNSKQRLWQMRNGYALPSVEGLKEINQKLGDMTEPARDEVRQALQIGLHWNTQVTLGDTTHVVSQSYCSAMPVAYTRHSPQLWEPLATLVLEAAYEATLCAALLNKAKTGNRQLFLTLLGGGAFGNNPDWIIGALRRSLDLYADCGLDVSIVSYGSSNRAVRQLVQEFS